MALSFLTTNVEWFWAFTINAILIVFAYRYPLLTKAGWIHAGALGTILLGCLGFRGWIAVFIYLMLGSLVTRIGFKYKQSAGLAEARGGRRGPENVWGSAATGAFLAILIKSNIGSADLLLIGFAASFAAKLADTFGSEIGKRYGGKSYLITSFKEVPPGTDGAISIEGTLASALGSILMALSMSTIFAEPLSLFIPLIVASGMIATLAESFLGALAQNRFSWLSNELVNSLQTSFAAAVAIFVATLWL